jgi:hypothetical protein
MGHVPIEECAIKDEEMERMKKAIIAIATLALIMGFSSLAPAQALDSGAKAIALNATLNESLTLNLSASSVNFALAAGNASNAGSANVTATTKWVLKPGRTAVAVYAYFTSATVALTDGGGNNIPASAFSIADNSGAATALTAVTPYNAGASGLRLENVTITGTNKSSQVTDNMAFNIDLSGGTLPQLPAGTYTGTLNIQAQATP